MCFFCVLLIVSLFVASCYRSRLLVLRTASRLMIAESNASQIASHHEWKSCPDPVHSKHCAWQRFPLAPITSIGAKRPSPKRAGRVIRFLSGSAMSATPSALAKAPPQKRRRKATKPAEGDKLPPFLGDFEAVVAPPRHSRTRGHVLVWVLCEENNKNPPKPKHKQLTHKSFRSIACNMKRGE